jgi:hypothetical protein
MQHIRLAGDDHGLRGAGAPESQCARAAEFLGDGKRTEHRLRFVQHARTE